MIKLTPENYFSKENPYLSNSKCNNWLRDKEYFHEKHILHSVPNVVTDALVFGSAVDTWLTEGEEAFRKEFIAVDRRSRKSEIPWSKQLSRSVWDEIEAVCRAVEATDAYQALEGHKKQVILSHDMDLTHFKGIAGVLDFLLVDGDSAVITDLKTTKNVDTNKYHWSCVDYGYYRQLAMYDMLVRKNYPEVKHITHRHIAVEKKTNKVRTFSVAPQRIALEKEVLVDIFADIKQEVDFKNPPVTWEDTVTIGE